MFSTRHEADQSLNHLTLVQIRKRGTIHHRFYYSRRLFGLMCDLEDYAGMKTCMAEILKITVLIVFWLITYI